MGETKMAEQNYHIDCDEVGYCVKNSERTIASFALIDDAYAALREFQSKKFPENWAKVPPAMQLAKQRCYEG